MDLIKTLLVYMVMVVSGATEASPALTPPPPQAQPSETPALVETAAPSQAPTLAPTFSAAPTMTPTPTPYTTLQVGDRGEDVKKLQRRLAELEAYRFGVRFNTALMTVFALVCIVFAEPIMRMFSAGDASVVATGALALRLNLLALLFMPFAFSANTMLQCVGRPYLATLLALMPQGLFYIPALCVLPRLFEQTGILLAPIAGWGMAAAVCAPVVVGFFRELGEKEKKESA